MQLHGERLTINFADVGEEAHAELLGEPSRYGVTFLEQRGEALAAVPQVGAGVERLQRSHLRIEARLELLAELVLDAAPEIVRTFRLEADRARVVRIAHQQVAYRATSRARTVALAVGHAKVGVLHNPA